MGDLRGIGGFREEGKSSILSKSSKTSSEKSQKSAKSEKNQIFLILKMV